MTDLSALSVLVLAGGISHERDVSLRSGRRVIDALEPRGVRAELVDPDATLLPRLVAQRPDIIFPAVHGASGEDGALLELIAALGIPYVGSPAASARLAWSKPVAREVVSRAGVSVPEAITLTRDAFRELGASSVLDVVREVMPGEIVVKPGSGGSAQGVSVVTHLEYLPRALVEAFTYSDTALCERKVLGTEVAVTVIESDAGPRSLPAVEIHPLAGHYTFEARYNAGETRFFAPARLSETVNDRIRDTALTAFAALGLRDLGRIDLIVDADGEVWFLEANVIPGMTETSLMPLAIDAAGLNAGEVYTALLLQALSR